ncbi:MAG TPA: chloride channel protein [Humisphaera sp.]
MVPLLQQSALRLRLATDRILARLGLGEHAILVPLALIIGILTSGLAVAFHELIAVLRDALYQRSVPADVLYGAGLPLLVVFPAAGGLVVGAFNRFVKKNKGGHGVVDVIETVLRSRGRINPLVSLEQILTSAVTIGSGGSAGAEGPIVQIGAGVSSGVGTLFQVGRTHLPALIGCGTAAGISAIFGAPIGGVLFTLEVILLDFSIRAFTPIVLASVVAYVTTQAIFTHLHGAEHTRSIFHVAQGIAGENPLTWSAVPAVAALGIGCGLVGVTLTLAMHRSEELFRKVRAPAYLRPAIGGGMLGVLGVLYVLVFGWLMLGTHKPFDFRAYPMPAFYGDGYGVIGRLLDNQPGEVAGFLLVCLLAFLVLAKIVGTALTLSSGGSGGVIAPSLFLGAVTGYLLGIIFAQLGWAVGLTPGYFALIGMGSVLAAVVHAPLASILILMEVTNQKDVVVPAMLACVAATGAARLVSKDSIYTLGLRRRGVLTGSGSDVALLRRITVDELDLEPVRTFPARAPLADLLKSYDSSDGEHDFVLIDDEGRYVAMALAEDVRTAMLQQEAVPYMMVEDVGRADVPTVKTTDDLAAAFDAFGRHDVARLPVVLPARPGRVIGLVGRKELMRRYHDTLVGR